MNLLRLIQIAKIAILGAASFLCVAGGVAALRVGTSILGVATQASQQIAKIDKTQQLLDKALIDTKNLIVHLDMTADEARKVSKKESLMLDGVNAQVTATLGHVDQSVVALTKNQNELTLHSVQTIDAGTVAVTHLQGVLDQSASLLIASQATLRGLDTVINDPSIPATLKSVAVASDATAGGMQHVENMTSDADTALHSYLNPTWKIKVANWTLKIVHAAGGWF